MVWCVSRSFFCLDMIVIMNDHQLARQEVVCGYSVMEQTVIYIHYGADKYFAEYFIPIRNGGIMGKPRDNTGLWASRFDSNYGWKEWCEENNFNLHKLRKSFSFSLAKSANTLLVSHPKELEKLPLIKPYHYVEKNWDLGEHPTAQQIEEFMAPGECAMLDYERMSANGIDAIEIEYNYLFRDALPTWDCSSIFIMNPNIIVPLKRRQDIV